MHQEENDDLFVSNCIAINNIDISRKKRNENDLFYSFIVYGHSTKELGSNFSKLTDGNGLLLADFPFRTCGRRWRLARMSQAMSQPQANGSEFN